MSDERSFGVDMVPMFSPDFADAPTAPAPVTEMQRDETVNADVLRRDLHVLADALVRRVRALPIGGPIDLRVPSIAREAASDIEQAIRRYLNVECTYRKAR